MTMHYISCGAGTEYLDPECVEDDYDYEEEEENYLASAQYYAELDEQIVFDNEDEELEQPEYDEPEEDSWSEYL